MRGLGRTALLAREVALSIFTQRVNRMDFLRQALFIGIRSLPVVLTTGAFTGMVLSAQTYFQFHKVKMDTTTLAIVSVSLCSELGPVLTALMVSGRVGAAMAAEIGTMRVTEQVDALRTLAAHPVDYLVVPRVLATVMAMPLLTAQSIMVGIAAGYAVTVGLMKVNGTYVYANMVKYSSVEHVVNGMIKSLVFGAIIAIVSCQKGMTCRDGAEGVGRATTEAVVTSSISILMANFFLTLLLGRINPP